jgi:cyclopropane-fatty-acyl-phospholipid synthase
LGAGESYVDGWWDCEALDQLAVRVLSADLLSKVERSLELWLAVVGTKLLNRQRGERGHAVAAVHYDLGNDLFAAMLGPKMNYSCGYWLRAADLDEAQEHKMDLICRKLQWTPDDHLLDIGCGWGGLARHAAEKYGCKVTASRSLISRVNSRRTYVRAFRSISSLWTIGIFLRR